MVMRAFEKAGIEKVEEIAGDFALKVGDGESTVFLSNVYSNYCSAPRNKRSSVLAEFVRHLNQHRISRGWQPSKH